MKPVPAAFAVAATLLFSACNYTKPVMYINLVNTSGHSMKNVELRHPTGIFGLSELRNDQTHRHMAPIGSPCKFNVMFEDEAGRKHKADYDLGAKCPTEIAFQLDGNMQLSERTIRP